MFQVNDYRFRKCRESDAFDLFDLKENGYSHFHSVKIQNLEDQKEWMKDVPDDEILFVVECKKARIEIGYFYISKIDYINLSANASWGLYERFRGKKLGQNLIEYGLTICVNFLNLRRISCEILVDNLASKTCAKRSGFCFEGLKRQSVYKNGVYLDSEMYAFLKKSV